MYIHVKTKLPYKQKYIGGHYIWWFAQKTLLEGFKIGRFQYCMEKPMQVNLVIFTQSLNHQITVNISAYMILINV